ncbi:MAG: type II toxin-antitoxin system HicA family toxin [Armatimonadetes bacterium]|nr:type II toxin-antitoxin system HicA family toxin [Armatimonadota bacterium]
MPKLPVVSGEDTVKALLRPGYVVRRQTGEHRIMQHPENGRVVPVPVHGGKDLKPGTLRSIIRQSGLTVEQFCELLN